ncbi:MAG: hypothetical protein WCB12_12770 [Bryobacteraceae bacterium]
MDTFAERYLPVEGQTFLSRSGTWLCELNGPVDVTGVDRRIFSLTFKRIKADPRWKGPLAEIRKLELRTSLASFTFDPSYAGWLRLVIDARRKRTVYPFQKSPALLENRSEPINFNSTAAAAPEFYWMRALVWCRYFCHAA